MKSIVLTFSLSVLFFLSSDLFATATRDTIFRQSYKITKTEFLNKYGTDDTSRALIQYYFSKRGNGHVFIGLASTAVIGEVLVALSSGSGEDANSTAKLIALTAYTLIVFVPSLVLFPLGISDAAVFSKKELYIALMDYQAGKGIRKKYKKSLLTYMKYHPSVQK